MKALRLDGPSQRGSARRGGTRMRSPRAGVPILREAGGRRGPDRLVFQSCSLLCRRQSTVCRQPSSRFGGTAAGVSRDIGVERHDGGVAAESRPRRCRLAGRLRPRPRPVRRGGVGEAMDRACGRPRCRREPASDLGAARRAHPARGEPIRGGRGGPAGKALAGRRADPRAVRSGDSVRGGEGADLRHHPRRAQRGIRHRRPWCAQQHRRAAARQRADCPCPYRPDRPVRPRSACPARGQ